MRVDYPTVSEPATPEYVLEVLRDQHRQQCEYDPAAESAELTLESTVAEWREACDLIQCPGLGRALNICWGVSIPDSEWWKVLEPSSTRRLRGVCELLARHVQRHQVRPARLLGSSCDTAGTFLTIRSLLADAGAPSEEIRPSTLLAPYTRRYPGVFLGPMSELSPGALPPVRVHTPVYNAALCVVLVGGLPFFTGMLFNATDVAWAGGILFAVGYVSLWIAACFVLPASVEFGDLRTFGDLVRTLARSGHPAPRLQAESS